MQEQMDFSADGINPTPPMQFPQYFYLPFPNGFTPDLILTETLKKLAYNIESIPVNEFEIFVNKYAV